MAHENLRFNLLLRNGSSPTSASQASYNPIYTDQYYGTHFGLFANFKPIDPKMNYKDEFELGEIALKLQNYTGAVTLGISSIVSLSVGKADDEFLVNGFSTGRLITLTVIIQAFNTDFEKSIILADYDETFAFKEGDQLDVIVFIKPIDSKISGIQDSKRNNTSQFVDEIYMLRDGEDISILPKQDIREAIEMMDKSKFQIINDTLPSSENFEILGGADDRKCKLRNSDIYII